MSMTNDELKEAHEGYNRFIARSVFRKNFANSNTKTKRKLKCLTYYYPQSNSFD